VIEWDEKKRQANLVKHGVDFAVAADFEWPTAFVWQDTRLDYKEVRMIVIGWIAGNAYTMVFTKRGLNIRVISLRAASREERKLL
jgi:uncharacterized DUF497 family protein